MTQNPNDPFVIENSLNHKGKEELFILLATTHSLFLLSKYGDKVFFMDGMHGINNFENNQLVTINVRVGLKGYPVAYLITDRYIIS